MVLRTKGIRAIGNRDIVIQAMGDSGHRNSGHRISGSRIRDFGVLPGGSHPAAPLRSVTVIDFSFLGSEIMDFGILDFSVSDSEFWAVTHADHYVSVLGLPYDKLSQRRIIQRTNLSQNVLNYPFPRNHPLLGDEFSTSSPPRNMATVRGPAKSRRRSRAMARRAVGRICPNQKGRPPLKRPRNLEGRRHFKINTFRQIRHLLRAALK